MTTKYDIEIEDFGSAGIEEFARDLNITHMRHLGGAMVGGGEFCGNPPSRVDFYALPHPAGWEVRVANTNADPVWEDEPGFAELAEECGVEL